MKSLIFDSIMYGILSITIGVWVYFLSHTSLVTNLLADITGTEEDIKTSQVTLSLLIAPSDEFEKSQGGDSEEVNSDEIIQGENMYEEDKNKLEQEEKIEVHKIAPVLINNHVGKRDLSGSIFGEEIVEKVHEAPKVQLLQTGRK